MPSLNSTLTHDTSRCTTLHHSRSAITRRLQVRALSGAPINQQLSDTPKRAAIWGTTGVPLAPSLCIATSRHDPDRGGAGTPADHRAEVRAAAVLLPVGLVD